MLSLRAAATAVVMIAGTLVAVTIGTAAPAGASTVNYDGLRVITPSTRTVYNGARTTVRAQASVASGARRQIRAESISAYRNGRRIAKGSHVALPAGSYTLSTSVRYRRWNVVTVKLVIRTVHDGTKATFSDCRVTEIDSSVNPEQDPQWGQISKATCINSDFPGQRVTVKGPIRDYDCRIGGEYLCEVGEQFYSDVPDFKSFTTTRTTYTKQRRYGPYRTHAFARRPFTVHNGGHRRIFSGDQSLTTSYFTIPGSAAWHASYSYDCGDWSGNWIVTLHQYGHSILDDQFLDNVIKYSDYGSYYFHRGGTYRFEVITECDWTIAIHWK